MGFRDNQRFRKIYSYYRPQPRPTDTTDYADTFNGLDWKQSVRIATTVDVPSLTSTGFTDISQLDSTATPAALVDEDRILVKSQTNQAENGIYIWYAATQKLQRSLDGTQDALTSGATCYVEDGTYSQQVWTLVTKDPITIGSTNQTWSQVMSGGGGGGGGDAYFFSTFAGSIFTTGSAAFRGGLSSVDSPADIGSDVFFFVSGSISGSGTDDKKAVFGGDVRISGSLSQGSNTNASALYSHAEGQSTIASGTGAHAEGIGTIASGAGAHAEGESTSAIGTGAHAEGEGTSALGFYSHAEGALTTAETDYSHAEGDSTFALGIASHAEGLATIASGSHQHVQGKYNKRDNSSSLFVIGDGTGDSNSLRSDIIRVNPGALGGQGSLQLTGSLYVSGTSTFDPLGRSASQIGSDVFFYVSGSISGSAANDKKSVFGGDVYVSGSLAQGVLTKAPGIYSHAEGSGSISTGEFSHAEGHDTLASGQGSHAEGWTTLASGQWSHAEGIGSIASGQASHAEGAYTEAIGVGSHAAGLATVASGAYQFVVGQANVPGNASSIFVIADTVGAGFFGSVSHDLLRAESGPGPAGSFGQGSIQISGSLYVSGTSTFDSLGRSVSQIGSDVYFFVSGSSGSLGTSTRGAAAFGGDVIVSGSLKVGTGSVTITSNDVQFGDATIKIEKSSSDLKFYDAANSSGITLSSLVAGAGTPSYWTSPSANLVNTTGSVSIQGDLTVNGTTVTVNTTNLEVKDSVIGLGFSSGTVAQTAGDRGIIAGLSSADNAAFLWKNSSSEFVVGRTTASATGSLPVTLSSYSDFRAANVRASGLQVTGSLYASGSSTFDPQGRPTSQIGSDVFFFVSGSLSGADKSVFGGDVRVSGSLNTNFLTGTNGNITNLAATQTTSSYLTVSNEFVILSSLLEITGNLYVTQAVSSSFVTGTYILAQDVRSTRLSGSLTRLSDGTTPYLIAGPNITINTSSNGQVSITGSAAATGGLWNELSPSPRLNTTASVAIAGGLGSSYAAQSAGTDVFFFVSGSLSGADKSLFGGFVTVSGTMSASTGQFSQLTSSFFRVTDSFTSSADQLEITGTLIVTGSARVTGSLAATGGLSGSLTKLVDGTSYLIAGNSISITSASNGAVTISSTAPIADDFFDSTVNGKVFTTGSFAFRGSESVNDPATKGTDVFFYVSGSLNGANKSLFGGDVRVSGSLNTNFLTASNASITTLNATTVTASYLTATTEFVLASNILEVTGNVYVTQAVSASYLTGTYVLAQDVKSTSLTGSLTKLANGSSYLVAGNNITITSQSNGSILFDAIQPSTYWTSPSAGLINTTGSVSIQGDLTVNGTTVTVNTTNLEVKDAVIGLGFSSGTIAQTSGDRGIIAGLAGSDNAAFLWDDSASEFSVGRTTSSATGSLPITFSTYSNFHAANIKANIVTASLGFSGSLTKLVDGSSYIVAGAGILITTQSNGSVLIASTGGGGGGNSAYGLSFVDGDLTAGVLTVNHNLNSQYVSVTVFDDTDVQIIPDNVTATSTTSLDVDLTSFGALSNTWHLTVLASGSTGIGGGDSFFSSTTAGSIFTTGSAAFRGGLSSVDSPSDLGADVFFFVSGSTAGSGANDKKVLFGGDIKTSGSYLLNVVSGTTSPTYNVNPSDHFVVFTANNVTGVLPPTALVGTQITFKDGTGNAGTAGGQMLSSSAGRIDGAATHTMPSINYTSVTIIKVQTSPEEWLIM